MNNNIIFQSTILNHSNEYIKGANLLTLNKLFKNGWNFEINF